MNSLVVYAHPGLPRQNPEAGQSSTQYAMRVAASSALRHEVVLQVVVVGGVELLVVVAALLWRVTLDLGHSKEKLRRLLQRHILVVGDENAVGLFRESLR